MKLNARQLILGAVLLVILAALGAIPLLKNLYITVLFITILSFQDWNTFGSTALEVEQTRQILQHTESLLSAAKDAETGERGFVITGDDKYL